MEKFLSLNNSKNQTYDEENSKINKAKFYLRIVYGFSETIKLIFFLFYHSFENMVKLEKEKNKNLHNKIENLMTKIPNFQNSSIND